MLDEKYNIPFICLTYLFSHLLIALAIKLELNKSLKFRIGIILVIFGLWVSLFVILFPYALYFAYVMPAMMAYLFWVPLNPPNKKNSSTDYTET